MRKIYFSVVSLLLFTMNVSGQEIKETESSTKVDTNPALTHKRQADKQPFFSEEERKLILSDTGKMHVYQTTNAEELAVLKHKSTDIDPTDTLLPQLAARMLATVQDEEHPGVGIAAPQVGINKKAIWVQRFDKEGEPFEFYVNPKIVWRSKLIRTGEEGCLSIPERREDVMRSYAIQIQYKQIPTAADRYDGYRVENIEGFTAVIFQHEIDHLHGILFPDRIEEQNNLDTKSLKETVEFSIPNKSIRP